MAHSKRNSRGEQTEKEILRCAIDQVRRYGYDKTTVASIARAAGKPASSVYWLFGDKDTLITRALEESYPARTLASQWELFQPDRSVFDQLVEAFTQQFTKSERQASVRTGIMLALEGAAADLPVQGPFWNRRSRVVTRLEEWWREALPALAKKNPNLGWDDIDQAARRMSAVTMWHLDGHYVGDRDDTGEKTEAKARFVAALLTSAAQSELTTRATAEPMTVEGGLSPREIDEADVALLAVTRELVAAHGYEGATIERICQASGMKRSSVYWRHKDKDSLVKAAVSEQFLDAMGRLEHLPNADGLTLPEVANVLGAELAQVPVRSDADSALMKAGLQIGRAHV